MKLSERKAFSLVNIFTSFSIERKNKKIWRIDLVSRRAFIARERCRNLEPNAKKQTTAMRKVSRDEFYWESNRENFHIVYPTHVASEGRETNFDGIFKS